MHWNLGKFLVGRTGRDITKVEKLPKMRSEPVQLVRQAVTRLCEVLTEPRKHSPLTVHGLI